MYSDETVENAWLRARACCECERHSHHHGERCGALLLWQHRGEPQREGAWEAHRTGDLKLGGWEAVNCCEILCWRCYEQVRSRPAAARPAARPRLELLPDGIGSRS